MWVYSPIDVHTLHMLSRQTLLSLFMLAVCFVQSVTIRLCTLYFFVKFCWVVSSRGAVITRLIIIKVHAHWHYVASSSHLWYHSKLLNSCTKFDPLATKPIFRENLQEWWSCKTLACHQCACMALTPTNSTRLVFFNQEFGWHHSFSLCYNFSFHIALSCSCEMLLI